MDRKGGGDESRAILFVEGLLCTEFFCMQTDSSQKLGPFDCFVAKLMFFCKFVEHIRLH